MLARAWSAGAEALVLDLEDSVPADGKATARAAVAALAPPDAWPGPIFVRVNAWGLPEFAEDARALAGSCIDGVVLPKSERADDVRQAAAALESALAELVNREWIETSTREGRVYYSYRRWLGLRRR